ncbi:MAG: heavy metal-binding domain-containing protein [Nitrospiria bacterium]
MICPVCGFEQRKAEVCVQCFAPLFAKVVKDPVIESRTDPPASSADPFPAVSPRETVVGQDTSQNILVATTQRVEGKRIASYFGVVHGTALIEAADPAFAPPEAEGCRKRFNAGMTDVLQELRREAARLKSNAVVAVSFGYQRLDTQSILLTAAGTAVLLKDP